MSAFRSTGFHLQPVVGARGESVFLNEEIAFELVGLKLAQLYAIG